MEPPSCVPTAKAVVVGCWEGAPPARRHFAGGEERTSAGLRALPPGRAGCRGESARRRLFARLRARDQRRRGGLHAREACRWAWPPPGRRIGALSPVRVSASARSAAACVGSAGGRRSVRP
ncbi:hypothetical protein C2845_PM09G16270 [Panicum miliaceum]|uniref:Uncharacterized protein n=1 Tax=Panicum miliaceum TaxID=4540 RepID=A0A3L6RZW5_PANMI|nr:hypothetical protein C2845_PM09G16270 [Panicum miliaceum]